MLKIENLDVSYGDAQVIWGVDMQIGQGEVVALIGSNGAGKSTLMRTIAGIGPRSRGKITYQGSGINGLDAHAIVNMGIALVPERRRLFSGMTVRDNMLMGAYLRSDKDAIQNDLERMFGLFPRLAERKTQLSGKLSGGEQQMCAIARGLMSSPKLLLIDEMSLGLAPVIVDQLLEIMKAIAGQGTTILTVEQDVQAGLSIAARGYVIEHGRIVIGGPSKELLASDLVRKSYLGL